MEPLHLENGERLLPTKAGMIEASMRLPGEDVEAWSGDGLKGGGVVAITGGLMEVIWG